MAALTTVFAGPLGQLAGRLRPFTPGTDVGLAVGVILLLSVLILPLPPLILDIGLALSVTSAVLVLMVAVFLVRPLDFTSFPSAPPVDAYTTPVAGFAETFSMDTGRGSNGAKPVAPA